MKAVYRTLWHQPCTAETCEAYLFGYRIDGGREKLLMTEHIPKSQGYFAFGFIQKEHGHHEWEFVWGSFTRKSHIVCIERAMRMTYGMRVEIKAQGEL